MTWLLGNVAVMLIGWVAATTGAGTTIGLVLGFVLITLVIRRRERR